MAIVKVGIMDDGYPSMNKSFLLDEINQMTVHEDWGSEIDLKDLNIKLISKSLIWQRKIYIEAFQHPNFYFDKNDWSWDILIFDWEYKPQSDSTNYLEEILNKTSCTIYIYSAWDKIDDIPKILDNERFAKFRNENRYQILNKSEKASEEIILNSVLKAFNKGEDFEWNGINFKIFPSKYVVDKDDFWKLQFLLGSTNLEELINKTKIINEDTILNFFTQSNYKFFIDEQKKVLSSSNNELLKSFVGELTEISMVDALKSVGIDKMEEAKEKGYTEIK